VDDAQLKLLARNLANAKRDLDEAIFRAYRHVYLLGKDNKLQHQDMGQITSSSAGSPVELILRELGRIDVITEGVSPSTLLKYWPPALVESSTQGVRDAFYSSPQLPRLLNADAVKRTICDGVTQGAFGYATKDASGKIKLEKLRESLFDADVDIADDVYIIKADDAQKLLEPPRLAKLATRPEQVTLRIGEQASFSCAAVDQYGYLFVAWQLPVRHRRHDHRRRLVQRAKLVACIRPARGCWPKRWPKFDHHQDEPAPAASRRADVRQRGTVPPQKWMNLHGCSPVLLRTLA
jgi:hypothetical protein